MDAFPFFEFNPITEDSRLELLRSWAELVGAGAVINTKDDEDHIRTLLEFPEREQEELPGRTELPPTEISGELEDLELETEFSYQEPISRQQTTSEKRVNFQQIDNRLNRIETQATEKLVEIMKSVQKTMTNRLKKKGPSVDVPKIMPNQKQTILESVRNMVQDSGKFGRTSLRSEVPKKMQEPISAEPVQAINYFEQKALWITDVLTERVIDESRQAMLKSIQIGESTQQATDRLKEVFEPYIGSGQVQHEGKLLTPHRIETIVRTNTTDAFNQGRLVEIMRPDMEDIVPFVQYSAIMDTRTTPVCRHLDGKVFRRDDPALQDLIAPNHFNCRSVIVPLTPDIEINQKDIVNKQIAGKAQQLKGKGFTQR